MRSFSADTLGKEQILRIDAICDRFESAWHRSRISIEEVLAGVKPQDRDALILELVLLEWELRQAEGERPRLSDYEARFASHAALLKRTLEQVNGSAGLLSDGSRTGETGASTRDESATVARDPVSEGLEVSSSGQLADAGRVEWVGRVVGNYRIVERIGQGGMGAVYRAQHTLIEIERAIKVLLGSLVKNELAVRRFLQEAQAGVQHLKHPNIVTTYDVNRDGEDVYLVMELLQGRNLTEVVASKGALEIVEAVSIVEQAATGLAFAHQAGLVHRDIKPHNIMLTDRQEVKLLDFGLVRVLEEDITVSDAAPNPAQFSPQLGSLFLSRMTASDAILGTAAYMSPEQYENAALADARSDVYSLGCTLYFLLAGTHAFQGDDLQEVIGRHLDGRYPSLDTVRGDVPQRITKILDRMLARKREERIQTADEVRDLLRQWKNGGLIRVRMSQIDAVRDGLIELGVVTRQDWDAAIDRLTNSATGTGPPSSTLMMEPFQESPERARSWQAAGLPPRRPRSRIPTPKVSPAEILMELKRPPDMDPSDSGGLTEYQLRVILSENADLLRLPSHVVVDQLGRGWKGDLFLARNDVSRELNVLRIFSASDLAGLAGPPPRRIELFRELAARLRHVQIERIARLLNFDSYQHREHGIMQYLVFEFIAGESLERYASRRIETKQPIGYGWLLEEFVRLCDAMQQAHEHGFLHLDLGLPVLRVDATQRLWITDLGVAPLVIEHHSWSPPRAAGPANLDEVETLCISSGALNSMAPIRPPESLTDPRLADPTIDTYALGSALYWLATGKHLAGIADPLERLKIKPGRESLFEDCKRVVPSPLQGVLERALSPEPTQRFATMRTFSMALHQVLSNAPQLRKQDVRWLSR